MTTNQAPLVGQANSPSCGSDLKSSVSLCLGGSSQPTLFDAPYECQRACAREIARLGRHCRAMFDLLLLGPASNRQLAGISLKYTGRVSELRRALRPKGWTVECYDHDRATGICWYRLVEVRSAK